MATESHHLISVPRILRPGYLLVRFVMPHLLTLVMRNQAFASCHPALPAMLEQ